jgi:hypothetical protein
MNGLKIPKRLLEPVYIDNPEVIRSRKSIHRKYRGQNKNDKMRNNHLQKITQKSKERARRTGADTLNSVQASYFERFHWPNLNLWTLQTVEHDGKGTRNSMLRGL